MDIFSVITLLGGLAFFLYGMNVMSSGLEKLAGGKLEIILKKMTSNKFKSLLLGMGITIAIQSSSADRYAGRSGKLRHHGAESDHRRPHVQHRTTLTGSSAFRHRGDNLFLRMKLESSPIIALMVSS
ncbi:MAG: hypothetical protein ACLUOF_07365 [Ruminococcus sp.]